MASIPRSIEIKNIPEELKKTRQWVMWNYETREGKPTKVPYQTNGKKAASDNPDTWTNFGDVLSCILKYDGIGIVFANGLAGVDLDHHYSDGIPDEFAAPIVEKMNSYTEFSPSSEGVHILCFGTLPEGRRKDQDLGVEMYDRGRFFTVTGWRLDGTPPTVEERTSELAALHREIFGIPVPVIEPRAAEPNNLDDQVLIAMACDAKNGTRFYQLWSGDISGDPSASEADLALCNMLAFWTGGEASRIDRLFRSSGLMRPKWDERHRSNGTTYGEMTIDQAIKSSTEFYSPAPFGTADEITYFDDDDTEESSEPPQIDPEETLREEEAFVPPLPDDVILDPAIGVDAGEWVNYYIEYADNVSPMTPAPFHESAALVLAAMAIARRLVLRMPFADIYPNLFVIWIARTTFFRKSTALTIANGLARDAFPFLLAAQDTTPEAFLSDLAGREPPYFDKLTQQEQGAWKQERNYAGQRGWILDEMSGLLAASGKEYNLGLTESLLRFYECERYFTRSTRGQGRVTVKNSYLSILGASTPAAMSPHLSAERLWGMGFWPRFAILTPEVDRPEWREPRETTTEGLTSELRRLFQRLPPAAWPDAPEPLSMALDQDVFVAWNKYNRALSYDLLTPDVDGRLFGTYGRLPVMALKVAMILAALDWSSEDVPRVRMPHLARAIQITEQWRASAHRAIVGSEDQEFDTLKQRILKQVSKHEPNGATMRDICRGMQDKRPGEIQEATEEMVTGGYVEVVPSKAGQRGRPTMRYRAARD